MMLRKRLLNLLLGIGCTSILAHAMVEDVCYPNTSNSKIHNCITLPANCSLKGSQASLACQIETFALFTENMQQHNNGRSLIHTDSTYLIAAAVGFAEKDAYWIAAYDEATDLGTFIPRDVSNLEVNPSLNTQDIGGLSRTSYATGGLLHHYLAVRNPGPLVNGLHPDVHDPNEVGLANLRAWAFSLNTSKGASASSVPLCAAGLTSQLNASSCYNEAGQSVPVNGNLSVVFPFSLQYGLESGLQIITPSQTGYTPAPNTDSISTYANDFVSYIGPNFADAALGTYMHSLEDRVSHHVCTDLSDEVGPKNGRKGFSIDMSNLQCSQLYHQLRHSYETGVPFNQLEPQDRTTEAALSVAYDELVVSAQQRGVLKPAAIAPAYKAAFLSSLITALQLPDALDRMTALAQAGCANGITPFPGAPACIAK